MQENHYGKVVLKVLDSYRWRTLETWIVEASEDEIRITMQQVHNNIRGRRTYCGVHCEVEPKRAKDFMPPRVSGCTTLHYEVVGSIHDKRGNASWIESLHGRGLFENNILIGIPPKRR